MKNYRIILKDKTQTGFYNLDIKANNVYNYILNNNININDIIKIIEYI